MVKQFFQEVSKKLVHLTVLVALIFFFAIKNQAGQKPALMFLVALLIIFLIFEYFRLELNLKIPFFYKLVRRKDHHGISGVVFFLSAAIIALAVFDTAIALTALLMTVFGDMSAAIIGKRFGTTMLFRNKTVVGFITELLTNLVIVVIISLAFTINIYVLLIMAFAATFTEMVIDEMDDNLVVPIVSGFIGQILLLTI